MFLAVLLTAITTSAKANKRLRSFTSNGATAAAFRNAWAAGRSEQFGAGRRRQVTGFLAEEVAENGFAVVLDSERS